MHFLIGADEVGLGAWAGPLVTCAFAAPFDWPGVDGIGDSKKLPEKQLKKVYALLVHLPFTLMVVTSQDIDRVGVKNAVIEAHTRAILDVQSKLATVENVSIVLDGTQTLPALPRARCVARADSIYPAVMAASIVAKVNRDNLMETYHQQYPAYGFDQHVGYGTKQHQRALAQHGVCPLHRRSYAPIATIVAATERSR